MITTQLRSEIETFARAKMAEHGLVGWTFTWDRAKNRFGCCSTANKRISMSALLTPANPDWRDTVLHEIAHALHFLRKPSGWESRTILAQTRFGLRARRAKRDVHGHEWKMIARSIGARPERCGKIADPALEPPAKMVIRCTSCKSEHKIHRVSRRFKALLNPDPALRPKMWHIPCGPTSRYEVVYGG